MTDTVTSTAVGTSPPWLPRAGRGIWVAVIYLVLGLVGLQLAIPPSTASPLFPAAGFALATTLCFRGPAVAGVFFGQFFMHMARCWWLGNGWPLVEVELAIAFAAGAALQAYGAAAMVEWWSKGNWRQLAFERHLFGFLIVGGGVGCLVSAAVGATALGMVGFVPFADVPYEGWKWYVGDTLGVFIFTPMTLVLVHADAGGSWSGRRGVIIKTTVVFLLVLSAFVGASRWEQAARQRQLKGHAELAARRVADRLQLLVDRLQDSRDGLVRMPVKDGVAQSNAEQLLRRMPEVAVVSWLAQQAVTENQRIVPSVQVREGWALERAWEDVFSRLAAAATQADGGIASMPSALSHVAAGEGGETAGLLVAVAPGQEQREGATFVAEVVVNQLQERALGKLPSGLRLELLPDQEAASPEADPPGRLQVSQPLAIDWLDWTVVASADTSYSKGQFDVTWIVALLSLLFAALFADRDVALFVAAEREEVAHAAKRELDRELAIAHDIQQGLLPQTPPDLPGFEIAGHNRPALSAGGDFYDFVPLSDGRLAIVIADVTGHGVGPALVAAEVRALFRATASRATSLCDAVAAVHSLLLDDLPEERMVTACFLVISSDHDQVEYFSAGHGPLLICRGATGQIEELPSQGLPFGFLDTPAESVPAQATLAVGDLFVVVTDGLIEAIDVSGQAFGVERLKEVLEQHRRASSAVVVGEIEAAVDRYLGGRQRSDDTTAVVIKRVDSRRDDRLA